MSNAAPLRPGDPQKLGAYRLAGRLGEGGQGVVYLGVLDDPRETVAIKLFHGDLWGDGAAQDRFMREVELAKSVARFCTAQVIEAGMAGDRPYIVSERIAGPSLNRRVLTDGPLTDGALDRLAIGTATALTAIHQAGIVHRDFKPGNVLLGPDGPRVIDFGIARALDATLTASRHVVGTPSYIPPEQFAGETAGPASDVFAWGATMAFAATGKAPFGSDSLPAVLNRILNQQPDLSTMAGPLRDLVARCLDKDPSRRPPAQQVLLSLLGGHDTDTVDLRTAAGIAALSGLREADAKPRQRSWPSRRALLPIAAAVLVSAGALAAVPSAMSMTKNSSNPRPRETSQARVASVTSVHVPDVTGLPQDAAAVRLRQAGLSTGRSTGDCTGTGSTDTVVRTWPAAGSSVSPGTSVDMVVARARVKVPDGTGWPVSQARNLLERHGFTVKVGYEQSKDWLGKVVAQAPASGATTCKGAEVTISVGIN